MILPARMIMLTRQVGSARARAWRTSTCTLTQFACAQLSRMHTQCTRTRTYFTHADKYSHICALAHTRMRLCGPDLSAHTSTPTRSRVQALCPFPSFSVLLSVSFSLLPHLPAQDTKRTMPRIARQCREKRLRYVSHASRQHQPPTRGLGSVRKDAGFFAYRMSPAIAGYDHAGFSFSFMLLAALKLAWCSLATRASFSAPRSSYNWSTRTSYFTCMALRRTG